MRRGEAWVVGWGQRLWPQGTREGGGGGCAGRTHSAWGGDAGSDEMLSPVSTLRVNKQKLGPPDPPQTLQFPRPCWPQP